MLPLHITIPQPCSESWAAMTPTTTGRHCAACQKTVIDFTLKTDAEILSLLARASGGACGRFRVGQLDRPLLPLTLAASSRWRAWLAAAVAVWGLREGLGIAAVAQVPAEQGATRKPELLPAQLQPVRKPDYEGQTLPKMISGVVLDSTTNEGMPGVSVLWLNTNLGTATNENGAFSLNVPAGVPQSDQLGIVFKQLGYVSKKVVLTTETQDREVKVKMQVDNSTTEGIIVTGGAHFRRPWPWHPRSFYYWAKFWITRPFRRY